MDITYFIGSGILLLLAIALAFVVPYARRKITAEDWAQATSMATSAVEAAEMLYRDSGMGKTKKEYVKHFLLERGIAYDDEVIDILIESAVLQLKRAIS